ncbi:hypothetical protein V2G26_005451 [Clonostachys chloroleuca]
MATKKAQEFGVSSLMSPGCPSPTPPTGLSTNEVESRKLGRRVNFMERCSSYFQVWLQQRGLSAMLEKNPREDTGMHLVGMAREGWASGTLSRLGYLLNCFDESSIVCLRRSRDVSYKYEPNFEDSPFTFQTQQQINTSHLKGVSTNEPKVSGSIDDIWPRVHFSAQCSQ